MNLQTAIKPRRDGSVVVQGLDGKSYTFLPDDAGDLVCEISHEPTVAHLLSLDLFMPSDEADFDLALKLTTISTGEDGGEEEFESEGSGLPIEANTPPAPAGKAASKSAAKSASAKP